MPFFDFHIHPTLKTLFSRDNPVKSRRKISPFENLDVRKIPFALRWCSDLEFILNSQSNLEQLYRNDVKLFGFPLFIPDTALIDNDLIRKSSKSDLKDYLHDDQIEDLIKGNPYQNLLNFDWPVITNPAHFGFPQRKINILQKATDYTDNDPNLINVFLTVEGVHNLCSKPNTYDLNQIKTNLDDFLKKAPILSTTLTHLQQSQVCNHAYAIQFVNDDRFLPTGNGIAPVGTALIDLFHAKKILIDVKHMSLKSRLDFYDKYTRDTMKQPVICTHAGLTGISYKDIPKYLPSRPWRNKKKKVYRIKMAKPVKYGNKIRPAFNISTINLFDEDVLFILKSGGMIGLSLDKRILGFVDHVNPSNSREDFPVDVEYISEKEMDVYLSSNGKKVKIGEAIDKKQCLTWDELRSGGITDPQLSEYHLEYFMQQIAHILEIARLNGYAQSKALNQICLGSDFDGIINPIWTCDTVDELAQFKLRFIQAFRKFCDDSNVKLLSGFSISKFAERLFYENGKDFVLDRMMDNGRA